VRGRGDLSPFLVVVVSSDSGLENKAQRCTYGRAGVLMR
jgi:hypothetical protein